MVGKRAQPSDTAKRQRRCVVVPPITTLCLKCRWSSFSSSGAKEPLVPKALEEQKATHSEVECTQPTDTAETTAEPISIRHVKHDYVIPWRQCPPHTDEECTQRDDDEDDAIYFAYVPFRAHLLPALLVSVEWEKVDELLRECCCVLRDPRDKREDEMLWVSLSRLRERAVESFPYSEEDIHIQAEWQRVLRVCQERTPFATEFDIYRRMRTMPTSSETVMMRRVMTTTFSFVDRG